MQIYLSIYILLFSLSNSIGLESHNYRKRGGCESSQCSHKCVPNGGGYKCECQEGYHLGGDAKSCYKISVELVRSCSIGNGGCSHVCTERNNAGNGMWNVAYLRRNWFQWTRDSEDDDSRGSQKIVCLCRNGYQLESDGATCRDIDECLSKTCCQQKCENIQGSFTCYCRPGFTLQDDGCSCIENSLMLRDSILEIIDETDLPFELRNYDDLATMPLAKIKRDKPEFKLPDLDPMCGNEVDCPRERETCGPIRSSLKCFSGCRNEYSNPKCLETCNCPRNSECNDITGECECKTGFFGADCEKACPAKCPFRLCNRQFGYCECPAGFFGSSCNSPCPDFSWGPNCLNLCLCSERNAHSCDSKNGTCFCKDGSVAHRCSKVKNTNEIRRKNCESGFYGSKCSEICECDWVFAKGCHYKTGKCFCKDGYTGTRCDRECSNGFYGNKCRQRCSCGNNSDCDHVTGECVLESINDDVTRIRRRCPRNTFGPDCSGSCDCANNAPCSPLTGCCRCLAGYYGRKCELECPDGWHGPYCLVRCACPPNHKCVAKDGSCTPQDEL